METVAMSTVDKEFADKLAAANGQLYPDDPHEPPVVQIVEYVNAWGVYGYGVTFEGENPQKYMRESEYVRRPRVYWRHT